MLYLERTPSRLLGLSPWQRFSEFIAAYVLPRQLSCIAAYCSATAAMLSRFAAACRRRLRQGGVVGGRDQHVPALLCRAQVGPGPCGPLPREEKAPAPTPAWSANSRLFLLCFVKDVSSLGTMKRTGRREGLCSLCAHFLLSVSAWHLRKRTAYPAARIPPPPTHTHRPADSVDVRHRRCAAPQVTQNCPTRDCDT